jgi:Tfp pilus assembly protein PilX
VVVAGPGAAPGSAERQQQLAQARAAEPWLREGSSTVQQQALRDFDKAMAAFSGQTTRQANPGTAVSAARRGLWSGTPGCGG